MEGIEVIKCTRCRAKLGEIREEFQKFRSGAIEIYNRVIIHCSACSRPFRFTPKNLGLGSEDQTPEQHEVMQKIRHSLGNKRIKEVINTDETGLERKERRRKIRDAGTF